MFKGLVLYSVEFALDLTCTWWQMIWINIVFLSFLMMVSISTYVRKILFDFVMFEFEFWREGTVLIIFPKSALLKTLFLSVMLLPNIEHSMIPSGVQPLLVFVNVKSGGCQGLELITSFRKLLNPYQVFDLDNGGPLPGLYVFRNIQNYKILVCGGDGTIGWVLQCLDNVGQDSECSSPACAIVPLGTGKIAKEVWDFLFQRIKIMGIELRV